MADAPPPHPDPVPPPPPAAAAPEMPHINAAAEAQKAARLAILVRLWIICALLVLALVGMAVTQKATNEYAWIAWIVIVSMFGLVCIWHGYHGARQRGESLYHMIGSQFFHWLIVLFFVKIIIVMERSGYVGKETGGPMSLVILSLGCVLAGIHFDWLFLVVGILLAVTAFVQEQIVLYLPYVLTPIILIGVLAVYLMYRRSRSP